MDTKANSTWVKNDLIAELRHLRNKQKEHGAKDAQWAKAKAREKAIFRALESEQTQYELHYVGDTSPLQDYLSQTMQDMFGRARSLFQCFNTLKMTAKSTDVLLKMIALYESGEVLEDGTPLSEKELIAQLKEHLGRVKARADNVSDSYGTAWNSSTWFALGRAVEDNGYTLVKNEQKLKCDFCLEKSAGMTQTQAGMNACPACVTRYSDKT